jgi:glycerol-3-phosphate dehydrogenase
MMAEYTAKSGVPTLKTGMLIAVPKGAIRNGLWREAGALWHLWHNGRRHGVTFRWITSSSGIRKIAPVDAIGGIFIPSVFVVDVFKLIDSLQQDGRQHGADIQYSTTVQSITKRSDAFVISTNKAEYTTRALVNSAGLAATEISEMAGGPRYEVEFLRGEYYELQGGIARWGIRTLVYPAMPAKSPSKGVHFGPRTDGRLFIGPNATDANAPHTPKEVFLQAARKFLPQITDADLSYSCAGIRPKYTLPNGLSDFVVRRDSDQPILVNLIGIDSPGLSSSLAIAEYVSGLIPS